MASCAAEAKEMRRSLFRPVILGLLCLGVIVGAVVINHHKTRELEAAVKAETDLNSLAICLASYASKHDDKLPDSWGSLVEAGYVGKHPTFPVSLSPGENVVFCPERLCWIEGACLRDFVSSDAGVTVRATSRPARIIWLRDRVSERGDEYWSRYLIEAWKQDKEGVPATGAS